MEGWDQAGAGHQGGEGQTGTTRQLTRLSAIGGSTVAAIQGGRTQAANGTLPQLPKPGAIVNHPLKGTWYSRESA